MNVGVGNLWFERLLSLPSLMRQWILPNLSEFWANRQISIWVLGAIIGIGAAILAVAFREAIGLVQYLWSGERSEIYLAAVRETPWQTIVLAPIIGGLVVGLLLQLFVKSKRAGGVADVIEARHVSGRPLTLREGIMSAIVTVISLGAGGSAGREGPVIHLGASFSSFIYEKFKLPDAGERTLLAAGVASAVSASFNAPIAGVLFAHEVILGHYSMRAFVPIVISSVTGTLIARLWFGESFIFTIPAYEISSYLEFPAFFLLGVICALVAIVFQFSLFAADYIGKSLDLPLWIRPPLGGAVIGLIGVIYPEILGIGYETTNDALWGRLPLALMMILIVLKIFATAITYASRFGGGVFSPALYLGALTGGVFGIIATDAVPIMASDHAVYSLLGMGAVAATVIGAPISTTVMAFELTGGYALSIALLFTIAVSHGINQAIHGRSFFQWQLEMRGVHVRDGPYRTMLANIRVMDVMSVPEDSDDFGAVKDLQDVENTPTLKSSDNMDVALRLFDQSGKTRLPVVDTQTGERIIGWARYSKALDYVNERLVEAQKEAHS